MEVAPGLGDAEVSLPSLRQRYTRVLSGMISGGAVCVSLAFGVAAPAAADQGPLEAQPRAADRSTVADRLAAIRDAVSDVAASTASQAEQRVAWWAWRNGGGGWRNGGGGWRNGGGGAWGNGGWHNYWRNW